MKAKELIHELKHHLPLTSLATIFAIAVVIFLNKINFNFPETIFEYSHFVHIVLASIVASAMFYKYKSNLRFSILMGILSSVIIGSVSDVIFPYLGAFAFNLKPAFHLPMIEEPIKIFGLGFAGSIFGIIFKITKLPHFFHVGISVFASLFYLVSYVPNTNLAFWIFSFVLVIFSVVLPCCFGDIIFPFLFLGEKIKHCDCDEEKK